MNPSETESKTTAQERSLSRSIPSPGRQLMFWSIAAVGAAADLISKSMIFDWLREQPANQYEVVEGFFTLVIRYNDGAAFGIGSGLRWFLVSVSFLALIFVVGIFLFGRIRSLLMHVALALFTAGILGNLYDRLFHNGLVRDFLDVVYWPGKHWPAFNVADSLLCIAVGLMIIASFLHGNGEDEEQADTTSASSQTPAHPHK